MHFDYKLIKWIPKKKVLRWLWNFFLVLAIGFLIKSALGKFLRRKNSDFEVSNYDADKLYDISNSIGSNSIGSKSLEQLAQKTYTPITTRSHILIISKSPQDPPNRKSNRNLLIMMRMFESLRFKYTIHHIKISETIKGGKFPSLTETKEPNHGRFSLVNSGL